MGQGYAILQVLIVQSDRQLALEWAEHLRREGQIVHVTHGQRGAVTVLQLYAIEVMLLDLVLEEGAALAVADFAGFRQPQCRVIFLTNTAVFRTGRSSLIPPTPARSSRRIS